MFSCTVGCLNLSGCASGGFGSGSDGLTCLGSAEPGSWSGAFSHRHALAAVDHANAAAEVARRMKLVTMTTLTHHRGVPLPSFAP